MDIILYLLIGLWLVWIEDKYFAIGSSEVHINGNITAEVNSNDIRLECSFTLGEGDAFYSTALTTTNATKNKFIEIAGYQRNTKPLFTPVGMDLFGNAISFIRFDENHNMFKFAFDNVTCRHERRYKCFLYITSSSSVFPRPFESDAAWISVTVPPSKPEMNLPTKVNDLSGGKRNKRSATITPKNDTRDQDFLEGDNITFLCEGDVGRPEGSIVWQKIYANDEKLTYSNTFTETIPESCSNDGNSTLTMQVTGDDNQAIIRCIIKSEVSNMFLYDDSEPLQIQFQVRIPVIELQPDKTVFPEGDSVQLKCQSEGNPSPSYSWLKGNGSNETIIAYTDSFVIKKANIADSGLYTCCTNNSIDGNVYKAFKSIYISIENTNDLSEDKNNSSENNHNILIWIGIAGGFLIFAVIIASAIYRRGEKRKRPSTSSSSKYAEENLNENSSDHYASSVPDVYDVLHDNRYKTDKDEAYDRMSELKRLPENGKKSKITSRDETESSNKSSQIERNNTQPWVNDAKGKGNQQTNSDSKSSFEYNQTRPQNNQAFESEEYQQVDSVSLDSIEDNGSKQ